MNTRQTEDAAIRADESASAEQERIDNRNLWWNRLLTFFGIQSNTNLGIVIETIGKWWKEIFTIAGGVFGSFAAFTNPIMYCGQALVRVLRVAGRKLGIQLEDETAAHDYQTAADLVSFVLFGLAVTCFFGALIAPPVGIAVAWLFALAGFGVTGYFDYAHQEKLAKEKFENLQAAATRGKPQEPSEEYSLELLSTLNGKNEKAKAGKIYICEKTKKYVVRDRDGNVKEGFLNGVNLTNASKRLKGPKLKSDVLKVTFGDGHTLSKLEAAELDYNNKRNAKRLFYAFLFGLTVFALCGAAALFMPPAILPILFVAVKVANMYLGGVALAYFANAMFPTLMDKITNAPSRAWNWVSSSAKYVAEKIANINYLSGLTLMYFANVANAMFSTFMNKVNNALSRAWNWVFSSSKNESTDTIVEKPRNTTNTNAPSAGTAGSVSGILVTVREPTQSTTPAAPAATIATPAAPATRMNADATHPTWSPVFYQPAQGSSAPAPSVAALDNTPNSCPSQTGQAAAA